MANETFKPGDVVQLKSGSPSFTVQFADKEWAYCWFWNAAANQIQSGIKLPVEVLKFPEKPNFSAVA